MCENRIIDSYWFCKEMFSTYGQCKIAEFYLYSFEYKIFNGPSTGSVRAQINIRKTGEMKLGI